MSSSGKTAGAGIHPDTITDNCTDPVTVAVAIASQVNNLVLLLRMGTAADWGGGGDSMGEGVPGLRTQVSP
jgi:hypothetical protein